MRQGITSLIPVLFLVVVGCKSKPEATPPPPPRVTWSEPIFKDDERDYDEYNGWLVAKHPVEVRSKVRGFVKKIHFKDPPKDKPGEGEIIAKDTPLFDLDPGPFQDAIVQAEQRVNVFKAQKVAADKDLVRVTELKEKGGASQAQVEKSQAEGDSLKASITAAETEVKDRIRDRDEYAKIKAPIEGRIGRSLVSEGSLVQPGETLLATINSVDPIKVQFYMDEPSVQRYRKSVAKKKNGALPQLRELEVPFKFALDTDDDFTREGVLDFADNQTDAKTGKILVRGETGNKNRLLLVGDHVRVRVPITENYEALLVPDTAVNTDQDKRYLLVIDDENIVQRRDVRLGKLLDNGLRVIETNLKRKDRVIIEGTQRARIGSPVTPEHQDLAKEMKNREAAAN